MKTLKAYKFRLLPGKDQESQLRKTFGCVRFYYNQALADARKSFENTGKTEIKTPASYKTEETSWLKEVDSVALCFAQIALRNAFVNFFKNPKHFKAPKFKSKKAVRKSYTTMGPSVKLKGNLIYLPKVGNVRLVLHRSLPVTAKIKHATVSADPAGRYFVSITFEYDNQVPEVKQINNALGLDFSCVSLYVTSEGNSLDFPGFIAKSFAKLARAQRKLSHMKRGSNNYCKQRLRIACVHGKISNQRKDWLHKETYRLAENYDAVCLETLDLQEMASRYGNAVGDEGAGMFTRFLVYKMSERGKSAVFVDKYFPSSQLCSNCGTRNVKVKDLSVRSWKCDSCGASHDRDANAARNILAEGLRLLEKEGVLINVTNRGTHGGSSLILTA